MEIATDTSTLDFEFYSNVKSKKVEWLWYPYIPYGKLTVLQGDPGEGKSTFMLNLTSILSVGGVLPTGEAFPSPQNAIYQCAEDSPADTIKPRLIAAGADCSRIAFIKDTDNLLTLDDKRIEKTIKELNARLFIIDPIQAYIPQDADMLNATKMRSVLRQLANVAEETKCAIVLVGHMNKNGSGKNLYRSLGSIDIVAIARSVLMIARDDNDPFTRYVFPIKSSLAPEGDALGFSIGTDEGFKWIGKCNINKEHYSEEYSMPKTKKELAKKYLEEILCEGDCASNIIMSKLSELGIGERTVNKAKSEMNIKVYKNANCWYWHLQSLIITSNGDN